MLRPPVRRDSRRHCFILEKFVLRALFDDPVIVTVELILICRHSLSFDLAAFPTHDVTLNGVVNLSRDVARATVFQTRFDLTVPSSSESFDGRPYVI